MHTGGCTLDSGPLCGDGSGLHCCTLCLLAAVSCVFISFLVTGMPPSRPPCGHDFPLFFISVTFMEGFFQGVFVAQFSGHRQNLQVFEGHPPSGQR